MNENHKSIQCVAIKAAVCPKAPFSRVLVLILAVIRLDYVGLDLTSSVTMYCENGAFGKTRLQFLLQHTVLIHYVVQGTITSPDMQQGVPNPTEVLPNNCQDNCTLDQAVEQY